MDISSDSPMEATALAVPTSQSKIALESSEFSPKVKDNGYQTPSKEIEGLDYEVKGVERNSELKAAGNSRDRSSVPDTSEHQFTSEKAEDYQGAGLTLNHVLAENEKQSLESSFELGKR